jgi:hypothetical protein
LEGYVTAWKAQVQEAKMEAGGPEAAWMMVQFLMSALRSRIIQELGTQQDVEAESAARR